MPGTKAPKIAARVRRLPRAGMPPTTASAVMPAASAVPEPSPSPSPCGQSWTLTRRCAIAPRTFFCHIGALGLLLCAVGIGFWMAGYPLVMLFCGCQFAALCGAALVHARHATDGERVRVEDGRVQVASSRGCREQVLEVRACWARLERRPSGGLVLRSGRVELPLGDQLTPAQRRVFAEEFAASLAQARCGGTLRPKGSGDAA